VNSTLAGALAAVKLGIPVAHLEAGLRSFDRSMPEEINRVLVDQISQWCFTHSPEAEENLAREGIPAERVHPVGNTMIDTLVRMTPRIRRATVLHDLGLSPRGYLLLTLHRPALVDGPGFADTMAEIVRLAGAMPVVFPAHPRTRHRLEQEQVELGPVRLIDPVGYVDFLALQSSARAVITDSGGVQEETTFLRVPCFTLRDNTERPITVSQGTNHLLGVHAHALRNLNALLEHAVTPLTSPEGWDGAAAERAATILLDDFGLSESIARVSDARA
jgi:UDP-N-acetylglucosamine 2-epimerase (non-hydrolysing)